MKNILISCIKWYQKIPGNFHNHCKYIPTCSNYAIESINKHGCLKGMYLTIRRLLKCNPFSKGGIDLVPERKMQNEKNRNSM